MKLRIALVLTSLAAAAPLAAYASTVQTRTGDEATSTGANGCQVVRNADHSIAVHCSGARWATLHWWVWGAYRAPAVTVAAAHALKYGPTVTCGHGWKQPVVVCKVSQLVHHDTITSLTATFN